MTQKPPVEQRNYVAPVGADRLQLVVRGRNRLFVDGVIGLLEAGGLEATIRADFETEDLLTARLHVFNGTICLLVLDESEEILGAFATAQLHTPTIVVSSRNLTPAEAAMAMLANIVGVVNPRDGIDGLVRTIGSVAEGHVAWPLEQFLTATTYLRERPGGVSTDVSLTQRELEVLRMLHQGESIRSLAAVLQISPKTVESLQRGLYRKLGVRNKMQAIEACLNSGLLLDPGL